MTRSEILKHYIDFCGKTLIADERPQRFLEKQGINYQTVNVGFGIGFSDGKLFERIEGNSRMLEALEEAGIISNGKDVFAGSITFPIFDENKEPINIVGYSINMRKSERMVWLSPDGVFNAAFLANWKHMILTDNPLHALLLMQAEMNHVTFSYADESKYLQFCFRPQ